MHLDVHSHEFFLFLLSRKSVNIHWMLVCRFSFGSLSNTMNNEQQMFVEWCCVIFAKVPFVLSSRLLTLYPLAVILGSLMSSFIRPPNFLSLSLSLHLYPTAVFFLAWHTNIQECKTFFATSYKVPFSLLVMVFSFEGEYAIVCYTILKEMTCFDGTDAKRQNLSVWKEGHTNVYSVTKNVCNFSM